MAQSDNEVMGENSREDTIRVRTKPCWICGQYTFIDVPSAAWFAYDIHNIHIENAWPQGSAEDKQLLRTGVHEKCWDQEFPPDPQQPLQEDMK